MRINPALLDALRHAPRLPPPSGPYRIPLGWRVKLHGISPGIRSEHDCDAHLGPKALAVRAEVGARIRRPTTKATMLGARKRKTRKKRKGAA